MLTQQMLVLCRLTGKDNEQNTQLGTERGTQLSMQRNAVCSTAAGHNGGCNVWTYQRIM